MDLQTLKCVVGILIRGDITPDSISADSSGATVVTISKQALKITFDDVWRVNGYQYSTGCDKSLLNVLKDAANGVTV